MYNFNIVPQMYVIKFYRIKWFFFQILKSNKTYEMKANQMKTALRFHLHWALSDSVRISGHR